MTPEIHKHILGHLKTKYNKVDSELRDMKNWVVLPTQTLLGNYKRIEASCKVANERKRYVVKVTTFNDEIVQTEVERNYALI